MAYGTKPVMGNEGRTNIFDPVHFYGRVNFGSSAISSQVGPLVTWTRTGAGAYTLQFTSSWGSLVFASFDTKDASGAVLTGNVLTESDLPVGGTLAVELRNAAGTATDGVSGDTLFYHLVVSDNALNVSR